MLDRKIVAIARGIYAQECLSLAEALYRGGVDMLEVTFDQSSARAAEDTAGTLRLLNERLGDRMIFGAGTVTSPEMAEVAAAAGAAFIISPNTDQSVIARTRELELVSVPGAMTPTEIMNADKWGADIVKLFPSGVLGLDYIKAIRAPINHVKLMATGGVNVSNIKSFLDAGMVGVGVGGNLCSKKLVAEGRFEEIAALAAEYVAAIGG
ncbi:MAG: bifunctional 4-hydroxy-2-oxoglutarate aldolase/2-dehydro-3-deoxy-phosphogluconate aldolase [Ruminococcaceae bacterium]|nr:bifunctional 4-hydroxy-2-oxoglutarate aldolase/2-dehydro-3-deoxy-phosphogluconate aldolase [Oscillospiraceae bacterium]